MLWPWLLNLCHTVGPGPWELTLCLPHFCYPCERETEPMWVLCLFAGGVHGGVPSPPEAPAVLATSLPLRHCLSQCLLAAERHRDPDNSYKEKHFSGLVYSFRGLVHSQHGGRQAWCWRRSGEFYIRISGGRERATGPGLGF